MTEGSDQNTMTIEAELSSPLARVQIARFDLPGPIDHFMEAEDVHRLNLCLTPRPRHTRACFPDDWGPSRFEPVGDLFHLPPGHTLHVRGESGRQASILCQLRPGAVGQWLEDGFEWNDRRLEASLNVSSRHMGSLLMRLAEEARRPGFASEMLIELLVGQLAIELCRFCAAVEEGPVTGGLAGWRLRLIDERLRQASSPTLTDLAILCDISVRQLTRGFRASRGCSINDYVTHNRIEGAKRLLATQESVKAVAFAMGFASPSSFAFAFRRATGASPRQFRQRLHRAIA